MNNNRLYELHARAKQDLASGHKFNWILTFHCEAAELESMEITEVVESAKKWRSQVPPADYYFTHGQFFQDGVERIIAELKEKPTSNRALYSLISQSHIRESGDAPIPSFMTLQCQLDGAALYCTCYFRALEVCHFLKINLEEIRQTLVEIYRALPGIEKVNLTIFAFHAYLDEKRRPLLRPRIEVLESDELQVLLLEGAPEHPLRMLDVMLGELKEAVTAVSPDALISLRRIISRDAPGIKLHDAIVSRKRLILEQLSVAISAAQSLSKLRRSASRGAAVQADIAKYQASIDALRATLNA